MTRASDRFANEVSAQSGRSEHRELVWTASQCSEALT